MNVRWFVASLAALIVLFAVSPGPTAACGGFFCTTVPVDQAAERIIFTMDEGSISTYVQINYVGAAEDFAWVLPVPAVPKVDTAEMAMFRDLDRLTQPVYIGPRPPACLQRPMPSMAAPAGRAAEGGTTVLASGEVGPFGYHVVTSPDPDDLVKWLRENGYRITDEMVPLVKAYTDEGLVFLAMKLKQGQNATDIVPVKLTYESSLPMIPLRLTAVAATPDMPVIVWVFAKDQVQSINYTPITIADSEVKFSPFGGNDYRQTVVRAVDQAGGRAFVTELAQPTGQVRPPSDPAVQLLFQQHPYLTRLYTRISPDEMTIDPVFDLAPGQPTVSNVHDLSGKPAPWSCSDDPFTFKPVADAGPPPWMMAGGRYLQRFNQGGAPKGWAMFTILALTVLAVWRPSALARPARAFGVLIERGRGAARKGVVAAGAARPSRPAGWRRAWWSPAALRLRPDTVALLFLEMLLLQGFHEIEHIVQVFQRTVLGIGSGAGVLGSVFDVEPVHLIYNLGFLALLGAVYQGCRQNRAAIPRNAATVMSLLTVSFFFQGFHTVEHVVKMVQFIQTGMNGTPGIFGYWIPVVFLHLGYNTALYVPVVIAFFVGGFHTASGRILVELLRGGREASRPRMA
ncbi:MAG: DUF2330 domain-containing protein [Chloroflexi bacterium]|nr:DUF2330 domain-containing protein [Chloroflexota bacterium]